MLNFEKYESELKKLHPNLTEDQLKEIFESRVKFWQWLIENYDLFFNQ